MYWYYDDKAYGVQYYYSLYSRDTEHSDTDIHFLYEFNFKEVICDGHILSVKCCNNQKCLHSLLFMDS